MEKLFDNIEYAKMADKADAEQKKLYIWEHEVTYEVEVQDTKIEKQEVLRQKVDAETGEPLYHADGTPMMEKVIIDVEVPVYDEEGNPVMHTETRTKTVQELVIEPDGYYICYNENRTDGTLNPDYEEYKHERIGKLTCTKRVFALILQEFGITYAQLKELIASNDQAMLEWDLCSVLLRENPLLEVMASQLHITPLQLDALFLYANNEINEEEFRAYC